MFATLLGGLPNPDPVLDLDAAIELVVRAQEAAGLEPITDGRLRAAGHDPVGAWHHAAGLTDRAVKQSLPGPYSTGRAGGDGAPADARRRAAFDAADALRAQVEGLVAAGCPIVEIEETEAHRIGEDEAERALFREAHARLIEGLSGTHLSLSIIGKAAATAGIETVLAAPYASLAVDLIAGPDNWNLVTRAPGERGIVVGAMGARPANDEPKEVLLWAAHYAASTKGRGIERVGIGSTGNWANLPWPVAVRKMQVLGEAARLASLPPSEELLDAVNPQSVSARRAALGSMASRMPKPGSTL
jgi:methionine synthase II (cobalamin-independent)